MGKYKYLAKNIGLLSLSSFATKLLQFFLVPLYTNVLSTEEYGIYDLFGTTISVLLPILTLNISEAMLRFALENRISRKSIVSISTRYFIISNGIVAFGLAINNIVGWSSVISTYSIFFFLMYFSSTLSNLVLAYIRGIDRIADLSISSVICSIITILFNILFLVWFKWGLVGYFIANIVGPVIQCLYLLIRAKTFKKICLTKKYEFEAKEMLHYSKPMIANSLAWWVNNAADKYVIIWFCSLAENGVYSVASKIPSILNVFSSIFSQAWTLSAVKDFDPEDKNGFFANTYAAYNCLLTLLCSAIIIADKGLAHFLYAKDFYVAWRYVPWLTIAVIFGALSSYLGGFFTAVKDTKMFAQSSMIAAGINIVLNLVFTPFIGVLGAATATTVCYFVMWILRLKHCRKIIKLKVNLKRDLLSYFCLVIQSVILLFAKNTLTMYCIEVSVFIVVLSLYISDIRKIVDKTLGAVKNRKG